MNGAPLVVCFSLRVTLLEAGVVGFVGVRDELTVDIVGDVGLPVVGDAGERDSTKEERGEDEGGGKGLQRASLPALGDWLGGELRWRVRSNRRRSGRWGSWGKRELQRVLGGADGDALHAGGAFDGAHLDEAVDGEIHADRPWRTCRNRRSSVHRGGF